MLAGRRGPLDLVPMLAVRGREHHRVDRRVGEDLVEAVPERDAVLGAERLGVGARAVVPGGEAQRRALALHPANQRAPPPPDPDNRRPNHAFPPVPHIAPDRRLPGQPLRFYTLRADAAMGSKSRRMTSAPLRR